MKRTWATTVFLRENWACNTLYHKDVNKVSFHALFSKGTTKHWPCCFFLYFVPPRSVRQEILEFFQLTTFYRFNKRGPSPPMTRHLAVPNGALLTTSRTRKPTFFFVSHPSAKPLVLRDLECFLELKNQIEWTLQHANQWHDTRGTLAWG